MHRNAAHRIVGKWVELYPDEFLQAIDEDTIVYLPMGAIEWHNRHLPFNVDLVIAGELCLRVAERTGGLVLPPNPWATACTFRAHGRNQFEHSVGTLALFDDALHQSLLRTVVKGIVDNGFRRIAILAGHVGKPDRDNIEQVTAEVSHAGDTRAVHLYPYTNSRGDHAGHAETLMVLGLRPDLVHTEKGYTECSFGTPLTGDESIEEGQAKIETIVTDLEQAVREGFDVTDVA